DDEVPGEAARRGEGLRGRSVDPAQQRRVRAQPLARGRNPREPAARAKDERDAFKRCPARPWLAPRARGHCSASEESGMFLANNPLVSRRDLLKLSAAGVAGMSLSGWLPALAAEAAKGAKHKSCVLLWMDGGPSHVDTFDPKPDAGAQVQGELKAIKTAVPGVLVSEQQPRVA